MNIVFKTQEEILNQIPQAKIKNGVVKHIGLDIIGHWGNIVTMDMPIELSGGFSNPLAGYNSTISCGVYIRILFELFDIHEEDGKKLSSVKDIPCRVIEENWKIKGIGHFMKNKFVMIDDFPGMYDEIISEIDNAKKEKNK